MKGLKMIREKVRATRKKYALPRMGEATVRPSVSRGRAVSCSALLTKIARATLLFGMGMAGAMQKCFSERIMSAENMISFRRYFIV